MRIAFLALAFGLATPLLAQDPYEWNNTTYQTLVDDAESDGRMGAFIATSSGPGGPPLHVHDGVDEMVFVISGEVRSVIDGVEATYGPGEAMFIPRDVPHTYTVTSADGASLLSVVTPGGFEDFYENAAAEGLTMPADMARVTELAAEHSLRFTGPPLATQ